MQKLILLIVFTVACGTASLAGRVLSAKSKAGVRPLSSSTDYFRSKQTGNWNDVNTWQSSPDNFTWSDASLVPTATGNIIRIRGTHTVTISSAQVIDQVIIEPAAVLLYSNGILTILDDASGDDVIVQNGGVFTLALANGTPSFSPTTASVRINTNAVLRVGATGMTGAGSGVNSANFVYQHNAVLEYDISNPFTTLGVTYFPNVDAVTVPVFRTTKNVALVGSNSFTTFNGLFEANGSITFQNNGVKTFRNGITGNGKVDGSTSGKFVINGLTANLGGADSLKLPTAGLDIGSNTMLTMLSSKTVTGNINLLTNALVILGNYNLNLTGDISGGSATSHLVTNGIGKLILTGIGATARLFPVGANSTGFNPVSISNGGGFSYGVRVENGINPPVAEPDRAVNRTWFVMPTGGTPGPVNMVFYYNPGEGGVNFNYTSNLELGFFNTAWNVIQTGLIPSGSYQVATTVNVLANNSEAPLVLGNLWSILSSNQSVTVDHFNAYRRAGASHLQWKLTCTYTPEVLIELQRSNEAVHFNRLYGMRATALHCGQPFVYEDKQPAAGQNYYRLKLTDADGKTFFSKTISQSHTVAGLELVRVSPNPVTGGFCDVMLGAGRNGRVNLDLLDMQGRLLQQNKFPVLAGINTLRLYLGPIQKGVYQLRIMADSGESITKPLLLQ